MRDKLLKKEISLLKDLMVKLERYGRNAYIFNNHIFNVEKDEQVGYVAEQLLLIVEDKEEDILKDICPDGFYYLEDVTLCKEYLSELIKQKVDDVDINRILVFFKMIDSDDEVKNLYNETTRYFLGISSWEPFIKYENELNKILEDTDYAIIKDDAGKYPGITLTKTQLTMNVTKKSAKSLYKHIVPIRDGLYQFDLLLDLGKLRAYTSFYYVDCGWDN